MKKILTIALIATAFVFAAGCAKKPAPAPEPVMTASDTGVVKHKKHHRHHYKDKLGTASTAKDTAK
jgi:hypothetical protein